MEWKKKMKNIYLLIFTFLMLTSVASANDWKVSEKNGEFILTSPAGDKYEVESVGGLPQFKSVEPLDDSFQKVIYTAGQAGTFEIIEEERAVIIRKSDKKKIADLPSAYYHISEPGKKISQPKWTISEGVLKFEDSSTALKKEIILK